MAGKGASILILLLIVLVLVGSGVAIWWVGVNQDPVLLVPPHPVPSPNGYDTVVAATKMIVREADCDEAYWPADPRAPKFTSLADKEHLIALNEPALRRLQAGLDQPYDDTAQDGIYSDFRMMARLVALKSITERDAGNSADSIDAAVLDVRFGAAIPRGGDIIAQLVGLAVEAIGRRQAWKDVELLNAQSAREEAKSLELAVKKRPPVGAMLDRNKWQFEESFLPVLKSYSWYRDMDEAFDDPPSSAKSLQFLFLGKRGLFTNISSTYREMEDRIQAPFSLSGVHRPFASATDPASASEASLFPGLYFKYDDSLSQDNLLIASLALRAYKLDRGVYPVSLGQLAPHYLAAVPTDPFNRNQPLRYRRTGDSYLLYSVGPDGVDDGGRPATPPTFAGPVHHFVNINSRGDIVAGVDLG